MLDDYLKKESVRKAQGIPPMPLTPEETREVCRILEDPPTGRQEFLLDLLTYRVSPGVDASAEIKAVWLAQRAEGKIESPALSEEQAVFFLGSMLGGYNIEPLLSFLDRSDLAQEAADALKKTILVYGAFDKVVSLAKTNSHAEAVLNSWAEGNWFLSSPEFPDKMTMMVYKVDGEINTDDLSPAKFAWNRPDIPFHALSMGETRFPEGVKKISEYREKGFQVAFVGDVVGTGSSRKSATNSMLWHIGQDIPFIPNKRRGGIVIGGLIAPIFFNTIEDSGGLPLVCDVSGMNTGNLITVDFNQGKITGESGRVLSEFQFKTPTLKDEYRAGGRLFLIIGRSLTEKARDVLGLPGSDIFVVQEDQVSEPGQTLRIRPVL